MFIIQFLIMLIQYLIKIYFLNLVSDLCLGKILIMGRGKNDCWSHVTKVENGKKWICKYCNQKFSGGASRIEAHLGGKGGGIRRCSNYRINQEDYNNLASTSSNPPQAQVVINTIDATHDEGK
jgi:DNA-directed RNA polymerase subunit RPC12/RpoP